MVATMAAHHRSKGKYVCCRCDGQEGCRRGCATIGGLTAHCIHCDKINQRSTQGERPQGSVDQDELKTRQGCQPQGPHHGPGSSGYRMMGGTKDCGKTCRICRESGPEGAGQVSCELGRSACEKDEEPGGAACLLKGGRECYYEISKIRRCSICLRSGHLSNSCPDADDSASRVRPLWTPTLAAQPGVCCARCSTFGHTEAGCCVPAAAGD